MLQLQLENALKDLDKLIALSLEDIDDIKEARHAPQFDRLELKEEKIKGFEQKKAMIDHEISKLMTQHPQKPLAQLLDNNEHQKLEDFKSKLFTLHEVNQQYAKMVLSVGAFYNALLEKVLPTQMNGYRTMATQEASFLKVRV